MDSPCLVRIEWAEERNDLIQIVGYSEAISQVDPENLIATLRLQYEDDYEYQFFVLSKPGALGLESEHFRSACAQNLKLILVVVLALQNRTARNN